MKNFDEPLTKDDILIRVMEYRPFILSYLTGMLGDYSSAEDVFQEMCLTVCEKHATFRAGTNLRSWCTEIARLKALNWRRKHKKRVVSLTQEAVQALVDIPADESNFGLEHFSALKTCVDSLPSHSRNLLELKYSKEKNCEFIGRQLKRPVESIYVSLSRIRSTLKKCIKKRLVEIF